MAKAAAAALLLGCAEGVRVRSQSHSGPACGQKGFAMQIVNGDDAAECEWSWQVALRPPGRKKPFCGGTLISEEWVLTAAHCVIQNPEFDVVVGEHHVWNTSGKEQIRKPLKKIVHPEYTNQSWDFALVRLSETVVLNDCVGTACLPTAGEDVVPGQRCWTTGWGTLNTGRITPNILQKTHVNIISRTDCVNDSYGYYEEQVTESFICALGKRKDGRITDACTGDSGGPLVCQDSATGTWTLYGVTSAGMSCAHSEWPGLWARVSVALDWIRETMAANQEPLPTKVMCPDFAKQAEPDDWGDCQCPDEQICTRPGPDPVCPAEMDWKKEYFWATCEDCKCVAKA